MRKIAVTIQNGTQIAVLYDDWNGRETAVDIQIFREEEPSYIGDIYIGHVRDVVKNIEACFVEIAKDTLGYMVLNQKQPVFLTARKNSDKICEGDNLIVQVTRDAIKTKDLSLTTGFSLTGRYAVLTHAKPGITFSSKIKDTDFKQRFLENCEESFAEQLNHAGLLIRTEAYHTDFSVVREEIEGLYQEYEELLKKAATRQKYYCLKKAEGKIIRFIKDVLKDGKECELVTDKENFFQEFQALQKVYLQVKPRFYQDDLLPLYKLYHFESIFSEIYAKKVWMKSGAYLVIEYTEALTVIDVNTGKCEKGKNKEQTFSKINKEAALEIARQIRLRNISGIIIIDFIDVKDADATRELMEYTRELLLRDSVKTSVVDMTKLHLMEITRQKTTDRIPYIPELFSN